MTSQRLVAAVVLVLVYAASIASFALADLGLGLAIALVLIHRFDSFVFRNPRHSLGQLPRRVAAAVPLAGAVCRSIVAGSWQVVRAVLRKQPPKQPGFVTVVLDGATPAGVIMCALLTTLSPGSLAIDVDAERRTIRLHVLDAADPDAARRSIEQFYQRYQRPVIA